MLAGYINIPPRRMGPTACREKVNSVTIPRFPPPPRSPQNRSGFSSVEAVTMRPSAVTTSALSKLSQAKPKLRSSHPLPDPRERPPTPVVETRPPVTARPCSWVAASTTPQVAPPPTRAVLDSGSTRDLVEPSQVDAQPPVDHRRAGDAVPSAVHRDRQSFVARDSECGNHVARPLATHDQLGTVVDHPVEHLPGLVVAEVRRSERGAQEVDSRGAVGQVCHVGHLPGAPPNVPSPIPHVATDKGRTGHHGLCQSDRHLSLVQRRCRP